MFTCSKVDNYINEKDGVGQAVKCNPSGRKVIVEKGDCHRQNDQIGYKQQQHAQVPIEPEKNVST